MSATNRSSPRRPPRRATRARLAKAFASLAIAGSAAVGLWAMAATAAPDAPPAAADAAAAPAPLTHKPLRLNAPIEGLPPATDPEVFDGYANAMPFSVVPRKDQLQLFPCSQCHKVLPLNPTPRKLEAAPHNAMLKHGAGRMWCLDCHTGTDRDVLHAVGGKAIDFDQSYQLCGQCHGARQRDWTFGAHGKRVATSGWNVGQRQVYACTHCHDPHNPTVAGRAPAKPPPVRAGLQPMQRTPEHTPLPWQRTQEAVHDNQAVAKP